MSHSRQELYQKCKLKLLSLREEKMNAVRKFQLETIEENSPLSDETDLAKFAQDQNTYLKWQHQLMDHLVQINEALEKIEQGTYGICEETGEEIEEARLLAIPWTRLSLAGAETREQNRKRFSQSA